jgi:hypothetical protein
MLKQAVDAFNQIFGCIILLNVWYGCTRGLVFLSSLVNGEEQWSEHSVGIRLVLYLSKHSAISTYCVRPGIFQDLSLNLSILDHNFLDNFALRHRFERIQTLGKFISAT